MPVVTDNFNKNPVYRNIQQPQEDMVNNPHHYTQGEVECIDAIKSSMSTEAFRGFLKGNAIKYLWRYEKKEKPEEDLKKCEWYLTKLIESVSHDTRIEIGV